MRYAPLIAKLATVAEIRQEDVDKLIALCDDMRTVPAKQDIMQDGERPDQVHVIVDGWAARYKMLPKGSRQIVAFLIPGDFSDLHVAVLGQMDHAITAITRCRIAYIPSAQLDMLTSDHNGLTKALWWATLVDEAVLRAWVVNNGRRDAAERIAHLFCEMHLRMQIAGLVDVGDRFNLPLTQEVIADATGLTPVHTNRILQKLRKDGLVDLRSGMLTVLDLPGLKEVAGFDPSYLHVKRRVQVPR